MKTAPSGPGTAVGCMEVEHGFAQFSGISLTLSLCCIYMPAEGF
jgi:hypothetical protein